MTEWLKRKCPLCFSSEIVPGSEVSAPFIADELTFNEVSEFWRGFRKDSCFFTYSRCAKCGLLYCPRYFTDEQLSILYSSMGDNSAGVSESVLERTQSGYFKKLVDYGFNSGGDYLELGPDTGLLTKHFASGGTAAMTLIEPNFEVRDDLLLSASDCDSVEILDSLSQISEKQIFDTIAGIHVYDHLVWLERELLRVNELAAGDARLLIVVHDEKSLLSKVLRRKWPPYCLQHPQLFNSDTISKALELAGFTDIQVYKSTNWFPIKHLGKMVTSLLGMPSSWTHKLPSREIPLRLGNLIVVARKPAASHSS